jgi:HSP20 family molecular chaperone IbpA
MGNYYQEMKDSLSKLHELKRSTTGIVSVARDLYRKEKSQIELDRDLSPEGRTKKIQTLQKQYGEAFLKESLKLRDDYDKTVVKARTTAEFLLNEGPQKPSPTALLSFERQFSALKTDLLLETRPDKAMAKLKAFAEAQDDAYLASEVLNQFSGIVGSVLEVAGADKEKYKMELRETLESVRNKATNDEQREAQQIYEQMESEFGRELFLPNGIEHNAIQADFGPNIARHANRPQYYVFENKTEEAGE